MACLRAVQMPQDSFPLLLGPRSPTVATLDGHHRKMQRAQFRDLENGRFDCVRTQALQFAVVPPAKSMRWRSQWWRVLTSLEFVTIDDGPSFSRFFSTWYRLQYGRDSAVKNRWLASQRLACRRKDDFEHEVGHAQRQEQVDGLSNQVERQRFTCF